MAASCCAFGGRSVTVNALGEMMADAVNAECRSHACRWAYGIGDLGGEIYLTSGILTDWAQWALGAPSFTVELPPRTEYSGGFDPDPSTVGFRALGFLKSPRSTALR